MDTSRGISSASRRAEDAEEELLPQVRDVGARLEHVVSYYARLVEELGTGDALVLEFGGRLAQITRQLGYLTERLQELFVAEYERKSASLPAGRPSAHGRRGSYPRVVARRETGTAPRAAAHAACLRGTRVGVR